MSGVAALPVAQLVGESGDGIYDAVMKERIDHLAVGALGVVEGREHDGHLEAVVEPVTIHAQGLTGLQAKFRG